MNRLSSTFLLISDKPCYEGIANLCKSTIISSVADNTEWARVWQSMMKRLNLGCFSILVNENVPWKIYKKAEDRGCLIFASSCKNLCMVP